MSDTDSSSAVLSMPLGKGVSDALLSALVTALEDGKAEDIVIIDLRGRGTVGDYMVVASGLSNRHVTALAERASLAAKQLGALIGGEGLRSGDWALVDAGEVILHLFRPEVRAYYNLEGLWQKPEGKEAQG